MKVVLRWVRHTEMIRGANYEENGLSSSYELSPVLSRAIFWLQLCKAVTRLTLSPFRDEGSSRQPTMHASHEMWLGPLERGRRRLATGCSPCRPACTISRTELVEVAWLIGPLE